MAEQILGVVLIAGPILLFALIAGFSEAYDAPKYQKGTIAAVASLPAVLISLTAFLLIAMRKPPIWLPLAFLLWFWALYEVSHYLARTTREYQRSRLK